jgi:hypothetical protein
VRFFIEMIVAERNREQRTQVKRVKRALPPDRDAREGTARDRRGRFRPRLATILNAILRDNNHGAQKPLDRQHSRLQVASGAYLT